jgi:iron(III)-salmochelin esterase
VRRRDFLAGLLASACSRTAREKPVDPKPVATADPPRVPDASPTCEGADLVEWSFSGVTTRVAILRPKNVQNTRFPALVALHGHGEAMKGPERGALGWPNDYALTRALERVCAPPLVAADFEGLVTDEHLAEVNAQLAARPWRGLVVVCPYLPDLDLRRDADITEYGKFVAEVILPRVVREMPVARGPAATGIDGVSLGGAVALRAGLAFPQTFGAVGALQPAIDDARVSDLVDLARAARAKRPELALRITTSKDDYYRDVTHALSNAWRAANVAHDFSELPGPHDYVFNRGPGAYEMLMWHARVLAV